MAVVAEDRPVALRESEPWFIKNGIGIQIMETLAVGAFLTALAVQLGAPNWMIGALAAIPHLAQVAQLPALWTVEELRKRRRIYLISGAVARPMLLVIAVATVALPANIALWIILAAFFVRYVAGAFLSCAWNSWMRDLVPDDEMGRLFSDRQRKMIGVGLIFSLLAAAFVDAWKQLVPLAPEIAYALVYTAAFVGGAYSVFCSRHIQEPAMAPADHTHILEQIAHPFRHENYRQLMRFLGSWNFAVNLAAPFFTVYMLKRLEYSLILVFALATLSQLAAFFTVRNWGAIADRFTNKAVLRICCPVFILAIFAWTFTTLPEPHALTLPLLVMIHVATGIATAGVNLATGNIALKLAPMGNATSYLAASSMVNATAAGVAALLGGITVDLFAGWELGLTIHWRDAADSIDLDAMNFSHWDFFFLFSVVLGMYALHRLSLVREEGRIYDTRMRDILLNSARQGMRNLSTIAGLRAASDFPLNEMLAPDQNKDTPAAGQTAADPDARADSDAAVDEPEKGSHG